MNEYAHSTTNWQKRQLRTQMKQQLALMDSERRRLLDLQAASTLRKQAVWQRAQRVLLFLSMPDEIDTRPLIDFARSDVKLLAVPRMRGDYIEFVDLPSEWERWPRDRWNIPLPPESSPALPPASLAGPATLIVLPGLAFDRRGGRLGRGKGYYDRFLAELERAVARLPERYAYCYPEQVVAAVPRDEHDRRCTGLIFGDCHALPTAD